MSNTGGSGREWRFYAMTHGEPEPPSPAWHEEILSSRRAKIDSGDATFITLDELKATRPE